MPVPDRTRLAGVLERSRTQGFLGPGSVDRHVDHTMAFAAGVPTPDRALDLGAGGGVPGLVLAVLRWPACDWVMLDAAARRCAFLTEAVTDLELSSRVTVIQMRAEEAGRRDDLRATFDLVTARGFGAPAITVECGAPLLRLDGRLVVSEPPGGAPDRWSDRVLAELGLVRCDRDAIEGASMAEFRAAEPCPERYPRRVGVPAKRPLF